MSFMTKETFAIDPLFDLKKEQLTSKINFFYKLIDKEAK